MRESYLSSLSHHEAAEAMARDEILGRAEAGGLHLGPEHWSVINFVRRSYAMADELPSARNLARHLDDAFADMGGRRYLLEIFPGGPVTQASRLADLPLPPGATDPSFGTAF